MKLTVKIFKIFSIVLLVQITILIAWGSFVFYSKEQISNHVVDSLTKVDRSILEGVALQQKIGNTIARDLVAYRLLELNNIDSVQYLTDKASLDLLNSDSLKDCISINHAKLCKTASEFTYVSFIPLFLDGISVGYLKLQKTFSTNNFVQEKILITIGLTLLVVFLINCISLLIIWWKFLKPETLKLMMVLESEVKDPTINIEEFQRIQDSFLDAISRVKTAENEKLGLLSKLQLMNLSTQVAHDIRSPLEVLKSLNSEMEYFPVSARKRIQLSINRIEEIAFNLLKRHKESIGSLPEVRSEDLFSLLLSVISEKKIEFRNSENLEITTNLSKIRPSYFSSLDRVHFKSIISNVLNNAIESLDERNGLVNVELSYENDYNVIKISDTGKGISSDNLGKLFVKGYTTKKNGNGIGLYTAKEEILAIGGEITCSSNIGLGTTFSIKIPVSDCPKYFVKEINIQSYSKIIILDDDSSIHEVWRKRFNSFDVQVSHIYSVNEMFEKFATLASSTLFLCDFELMDASLDGIEVIKRFNHFENSILVTARNEEIEIQNRCLALNIKLLPKSLINYIEIDSYAQISEDLIIVLIDDDKLVRYNWRSFCKKKSYEFHEFNSVESFISNASSIPTNAKIYIDSNLGDGLRGEIESEKLFEMGYENLYLATGYEKSEIQQPSWIKEIYSKNPEVILN